MPIAVTAKKATGGTYVSDANRAGRTMRKASPQLAITAITGTPRSQLTRLHSCQPGTARSRENAKNVREQLVTQAIPQKNWPTHAIAMIASAQFWFICAEVKTEIEVPKPSLTAVTSVAANRIASSTSHPISAELATDCQMPFAAACSAPTVSSATCAEAS